MRLELTTFQDSIGYGAVLDLSPVSLQLALTGLSYLSSRYNWQLNGRRLTDAEWDDLSKDIALANEELMSSLVGLIMPSVLATVSVFKFLPCDGSTHLKADYPLLYDAIDAAYIVSGTQFRVPDLRDRVVVGTGNNYNLDDSGGVDSVTLQVSEIPPHDHTYQLPSFNVDLEAPGAPDIFAMGNPTIPTLTSVTGGGNAHENRQPFRALNWVIVAG